MRIFITSSLLSLLLAQQEWEGASAFGVDRRSTTQTASSTSSSSLRAAPEIVDAIASGASAVSGFDALNNINIEEIASNADPSKLNLDAIKNGINLDAIKSIDLGGIASNFNLDGIASFDPGFSVSPGTGAAVGAVFGTGGFLVGSLTSNSAITGENKRMENKIKVQSQKIEELSSDLAAAEKTVAETKSSSEEAIDELENKIFLMDQEFEQSTEDLKQDFQQRVQRELQNRRENIEQDVKFKYDIKMMREREAMLQEKLNFVERESTASSLAKQEEIAMAKIEASKKQAEITTLESDLKLSRNQVESLRTMIQDDQSSFNPFASAGLKLQVEDLQKDLAGMADALIVKDREVQLIGRELEELKTKRSNPFYFITEIFQQQPSNDAAPEVFQPKAPALPPPVEELETEKEAVEVE